jgi:cytochrome subunit of sulfide dehydrogenase
MMIVAWLAPFDAGSEASTTGKNRRTAKASNFRQRSALALATGMLVLIANGSMAADDSRDAQLVAICASCHRLDGRDTGIPSIIGLDRGQFVDVMAAFKSGERSSQIMHAIALSLSDGEIAALAAYLAAQPTGTKQ